MTDRDILRLYFLRDEAALAASSEKYGNYCRCIARNILENAEDAEECVNDTWLGAWNTIPPRRPENLAAYLGKLTRNAALNRVRAAVAQKRGGGQYALALEELGDCIPAPHGVEETVDARALTAALERFLRALPIHKRTVFVQRYWYLSSVADIAADSGMTVGAVNTLLCRLRAQLKAYLEKEEHL